MAFPKLLQKLFQNNGAGDKLRSEILPDMNYLSTSGGTVSGSTIINQVSLPSSGNITTTTTSTELLLNYGQGAWLTLLGKDFPRADKGGFIISTNGGNSLVGKPDGSLTWNGKPVLCGESGGFPVGFLSLYAGSNVPNGWFRCDGSTVANMQTNYPKLFAFLGTNVLPNYSVMLKGGSVPVAISSTAADKKTVSFSGLSVPYTYSGRDGSGNMPVLLNAIYIPEGSGSGSYDFKPSNNAHVSYGRPSGSWSTNSLKASVNLSSANGLSVLIKHD